MADSNDLLSRIIESPESKTTSRYVDGRIKIEQQDSTAAYAQAYKRSMIEGWPDATSDEVKKLEFAIWKSGIISL